MLHVSGQSCSAAAGAHFYTISMQPSSPVDAFAGLVPTGYRLGGGCTRFNARRRSSAAFQCRRTRAAMLTGRRPLSFDVALNARRTRSSPRWDSAPACALLKRGGPLVAVMMMSHRSRRVADVPVRSWRGRRSTAAQRVGGFGHADRRAATGLALRRCSNRRRDRARTWLCRLRWWAVSGGVLGDRSRLPPQEAAPLGTAQLATRTPRTCLGAIGGPSSTSERE
jgi:hypothetical protein